METPAVENRIRLRANLIFLLLLAMLGILTCRIAELQALKEPYYQQLKEKQMYQREALVAERGKILDSQGRVLAMSVPTESLYAVPGLIKDKAQAAHDLSILTGLSEQSILAKVDDDERQFVWVQRHLTPEQAVAFNQLEIPGFGLRQEYRRVYPHGHLASHIIGMADIDQNGIDALERQYDATLKGKDGWRESNVDALQRKFFTSDSQQVLPIPGNNVTLTIDLNIQAIVEEVIAKTAVQWKAESIAAVVIDPTTGRVLAMANYPDFDPNHPGDAKLEARRNRCLTDSFEPGSMNKPYIVSMALQHNLVKPETPIFCENGHWQFKARHLSDVHPYGTLSVTDVIAKSSNIGTTKIGLLLQEYGRQNNRNPIRDVMVAIGFGKPSGIDLPGEEGGRVTTAAHWSYHSDVSVCQGYEVAVTPLQMAMACSIIANRGSLMKPYVVDAVRSAEGQVTEQREPFCVRKVYEPETMQIVNTVLQKVVTEGTAKRAHLDEYAMAGKTGTSHKVKGGHYVDEYFSSFVAFAPANDPKLTVLVSVNNPHGFSHYGGTVAGPAVRDIVNGTLRYMKIPSVKELGNAEEDDTIVVVDD